MLTEVLDESLAEMFNETVVIEIFTGITDKYGQSGFAAPEPYPARLDYTTRAIRTLKGEEAVSNLQIYVWSTDAHTAEDRITLPPGRIPDHPVILNLEPVQGELGQTMVIFDT
jgi:hypothetical protein